MNADPEVTRFLLGPISRERSDAFVDQIEKHFAEHAFGLWAVEVTALRDFEAHFTPAVEIGWRLDQPYWGRGYATEAARATLADGFTRSGLKEIVSFTIPANLRSIAVMERLGMTRDLDGDFDHPNVPRGHPHRRHVLYRIAAP